MADILLSPIDLAKALGVDGALTALPSIEEQENGCVSVQLPGATLTPEGVSLLRRIAREQGWDLSGWQDNEATLQARVTPLLQEIAASLEETAGASLSQARLERMAQAIGHAIDPSAAPPS